MPRYHCMLYTLCFVLKMLQRREISKFFHYTTNNLINGENVIIINVIIGIEYQHFCHMGWQMVSE